MFVSVCVGVKRLAAGWDLQKGVRIASTVLGTWLK